MKQWLSLLLLALAVSLSGCFSHTTSPFESDVSRIGATPTPTPFPGGGVYATATPHIPAGTPTPGGPTTTYSVVYEVTSTGATSINGTFLDSNTTSNSQSIPGGTWTSPTCTLSSGYETRMVAAYGVINTASPTLQLRIRVNGTVVATQTLNGIGSAITVSYWLP